MGYITRNIAFITEPARVALAGLPNYIKFEGQHSACPVLYEAKLWPPCRNTWTREDLSIDVTTSEGDIFTLQGTFDLTEVAGATFFITVDDNAATAYNLRAAMLSIDWLASNYKITVPYVAPINGEPLREGNVVVIESKAAGDYYNLTIEEQGGAGAWRLEVITSSTNSDSLLSISGGTSAVIELDILEGTGEGIFQSGESSAEVGESVASLQKTYTGEPIWFDLNSAIWVPTALKFPSGLSGVFPSGSLRDYRVAARVAGASNVPFYLSSPLYAVLGHGPLGVERREVSAPGGDLSNYVIGPAPGLLLSDAPRLPWVQGQPLLINALIGPNVHEGAPVLMAVVEAYNCSGDYLGEEDGAQRVNRATSLATISFNPSVIASKWLPLGATLFRAGIKQGGAPMSTFAEFEVVPAKQHTLNYFVFLNRLGGWESFNFDAPTKEEAKPSTTTYTRTVGVGFRRGDSVEAVHRSRISRVFSIEGAPVSDAVARWLSQMAVSPSVFDGEGNSVIIDEMTLTIDPERRNMQRPNMKYHFSEQAAND